jgi:dihydroorotate dehydrogenase (fumarate)/dihydroorotate dehydrogenase
MTLYSAAVRPLLFRLDAERAHHAAIALGGALGVAAPALRSMIRVDDPRLETQIAGLRFPNPIGLAAGFDKSGEAVAALAALGFGAIEVGSVSTDPSDGNARPRLWRLPEDRAIIVHYGLPNDGADAVASRLRTAQLPVPLGLNIVKTNRGAGGPREGPAEIIADYREAARRLAPVADYLMVNLSCPNTEDGRDFFATRAHIEACLAALSELDLSIPVFLKVSPLGGIETIERVLEAADPYPIVSGFMFNLPPTKPDGLRSPKTVWGGMPGAVSGLPVAALIDEMTRQTWRRMDTNRYALFAAGGVSTSEDAYRKIRLGASLVQLMTALVYEGPGIVHRINRGLGPLLERDGVASIGEIVGADA